MTGRLVSSELTLLEPPLYKNRMRTGGVAIARPDEVVMMHSKQQPLDWESLLGGISRGRTTLKYRPGAHIFRQGQPADCLFYVRGGRVELTAKSTQGKEAIVATLGAGEFVGEGCLAGQRLRVATAASMTDSTLERIEKTTMARMLHEKHGASELFVTHLLSSNTRYEENLVDQLFNSSEKRLARTLLLLSHYGKDGRTETVPRVSQQNLAQLVGTTRARVSHFMNKFRKLGFIDYDRSGLTVRSALLSVVLQD